MSKHKPWKVLASQSVYRFDPWLAVERQKIELSDGRVIDDYHRITLQDFSGIVAQADDGRYLVTRQYRHGPGRVCLTLPGGALDAFAAERARQTMAVNSDDLEHTELVLLSKDELVAALDHGEFAAMGAAAAILLAIR